MKRVTREVKIDDVTVTVKELSVSEIRAMMLEPVQEDREFDLITDLISFNGIGVRDLMRFSDITMDQVEAMSPSHLEKVAAVVREVNAVFFNQYMKALDSVQSSLKDQK